jgi:hypothetical protein
MSNAILLAKAKAIASNFGLHLFARTFDIDKRMFSKVNPTL